MGGSDMRRSRLAIAVAVATLGMASASDSSAAKLPDLVVKKGSVHRAHGKLRGSFVVRNVGGVRARRSTATLTVGAAGDRRTARRFRVKSLKPSKSRKVRVAVKVPAGVPSGSLPLRACADTRHKVD